MKKVILLALAGSILFASMSQTKADFPRRGRSCSAPCFTPSYTPCHETAYVAPVVATSVTLVEVPTFVFSNLGNYPSIPEVFRTPQQTYQPPIQAQPPQIGLSDKDVDRIANVVVQRLQASVGVAQSVNLLGPPAIEESQQQPMAATQNQINSIGRTCFSCHATGGTTKGGLAIFDQFGNWNPMKGGQPYATPERIYERAADFSMPPTAMSDASKRLDADGLAGLAKLTGR